MTFTQVEKPATGARKAKLSERELAALAKIVQGGGAAQSEPQERSRKNTQQDAHDVRRTLAEKLGVPSDKLKSRTVEVEGKPGHHQFIIWLAE
jgi:hypothetical protein